MRTGPYIFLGQNVNLDLSQDVWAVFGELHLPHVLDGSTYFPGKRNPPFKRNNFGGSFGWTARGGRSWDEGSRRGSGRALALSGAPSSGG